MNVNYSITTPRLHWLILIIAVIFLFLAPIVEWVSYGKLIYMNGEDEYSYLNYDFAKKTFSATRLSSAIIIFGHNLGFSGSQINLFLDIFSVSALCGIAYVLLKHATPADYSKKIVFCLIVLMAFPFVLSTSNPIHARAINFINEHDFSAYYLIANHSLFPAILRSPESQLSIVAISGMLLVSVKYRWGWLSFLAIPFTYFFTGIYFISIVIVYYGLSISTRYFGRNDLVTGAIICALIYAALSAGVGVATSLFVSDLQIIDSRAPILGLNVFYMITLLGILLYIYDWRSLSEIHQRIIVSIMIASIMIYNFQIISGSVLQPQHFEIDGAIACSALLCVFILFSKPRNAARAKNFNIALMAVILAGTLSFGYKSVITNLNTVGRINNIIENPDFKRIAATNPENIFINDPGLSSRVSGLVLRQSAPLLSSIEPAFLGNNNYHERLLSLRRYLQDQHPYDYQDFEKSLNYLIDRHVDRFQNWQKFAVLRRGIKELELSTTRPLEESKPSEIVLFRIEE